MAPTCLRERLPSGLRLVKLSLQSRARPGSNFDQFLGAADTGEFMNSEAHVAAGLLSPHKRHKRPSASCLMGPPSSFIRVIQYTHTTEGTNSAGSLGHGVGRAPARGPSELMEAPGQGPAEREAPSRSCSQTRSNSRCGHRKDCRQTRPLLTHGGRLAGRSPADGPPKSPVTRTTLVGDHQGSGLEGPLRDSRVRKTLPGCHVPWKNTSPHAGWDRQATGKLCEPGVGRLWLPGRPGEAGSCKSTPTLASHRSQAQRRGTRQHVPPAPPQQHGSPGPRAVSCPRLAARVSP